MRIRWLKNGEEIEHNGRIKIEPHELSLGELGTMLVLWQTVTSDSGLYQCQAENEAGQASATMRLYVLPSGRWKFVFHTEIIMVTGAIVVLWIMER